MSTKGFELRDRWEEAFYITGIGEELFQKMKGKSFKDNCTTPREELRYLHILHCDFEQETREGELVVHESVAEDVLDIFRQLYRIGYPIERVELVDRYDADDERSMRANNSSAFNFRCISFTDIPSRHGLGLAVDINPLYNPYVKTVGDRLSVEPATAAEYVDRTGDFPHKIEHGDACYEAFTAHGFEWGGDWLDCRDYQHFEKPSAKGGVNHPKRT